MLIELVSFELLYLPKGLPGQFKTTHIHRIKKHFGKRVHIVKKSGVEEFSDEYPKPPKDSNLIDGQFLLWDEANGFDGKCTFS